MSSNLRQPPPLPATKRFFCHRCLRHVRIAVDDSSADIFCPICGDGFLEEAPNEPVARNPRPDQLYDPAFVQMPMPFLFGRPSSQVVPSTFDLRQPSDISFILGNGADAPTAAAAFTVPSGASVPFNPLAYLQNHIQNLLSGGASIQIVLEGPSGFVLGGSGGSSFGGPGGVALGDYFLGPGFEQLIQQLAENDPNRYGTPPASKAFVDALVSLNVTEEQISSDHAQCAICLDTFEVGAEAKQLPCKHIFHKDCILPWLELHSACPVCRHELPTDGPVHLQQQPQQQQQQASAEQSVSLAGGSAERDVGSAAGAQPRTRVMERRLRISLPFPLRVPFGSGSSSTDGGGESGQGSGGGGPGGSGGGHQPAPRHEDLD